jgi:hypothetical protein
LVPTGIPHALFSFRKEGFLPSGNLSLKFNNYAEEDQNEKQ